MPFKMFSRLKSSKDSSKIHHDVPEYSVIDPNQDIASPPYQERRLSLDRNIVQRPTGLQRTVSESSYTSTELTLLMEATRDVQQISDETLPEYSEQPQLAMFMFRPTSNVSVTSVSTSRPDPMCPCAQCHRLR